MDLVRKLETETASNEQLPLGEEIVPTPQVADIAEEIKVTVIFEHFSVWELF